MSSKNLIISKALDLNESLKNLPENDDAWTTDWFLFDSRNLSGEEKSSDRNKVAYVYCDV